MQSINAEATAAHLCPCCGMRPGAMAWAGCWSVFSRGQTMNCRRTNGRTVSPGHFPRPEGKSFQHWRALWGSLGPALLFSSFSTGLAVSFLAGRARFTSGAFPAVLLLCCSVLDRWNVLYTQLRQPCYCGSSLVGRGPDDLGGLGYRRLVNQGTVGSSA